MAIHDGVRPLVSETVIKNCIESAEKFGAAIPTLPMQDSIRKISDNGSQTTDRKNLYWYKHRSVFNQKLF